LFVGPFSVSYDEHTNITKKCMHADTSICENYLYNEGEDKNICKHVVESYIM